MPVSYTHLDVYKRQGYNCGSLTSESLSGITAYVAGKDYIGGLIGYNDALENTAFYGYSFAGGSVIGRDFVGGIAGVNLLSLIHI